jgi:hypothetical protein
MGLSLPMLLLGLAQSADQLSAATDTGLERHLTLQSAPERTFTLPAAPSENRRLVGPAQSGSLPESAVGSTGRFTMRNYYSERRDDLAPEYVGMTTCEPSRMVLQKRTIRRSARLVPANQP